MDKQQALYNYYLRIGDSCLIMGQRLAEWCSNGPTLEEDLALTNISLDLFGQAESYYVEALKLQPTYSDADHLAFRRNEQEYFNYLICEQENGDFAQTMVKIYLFSSYMLKLQNALKGVDEMVMASLADRAAKELSYHQRHSADWLKRMSFGTEESNTRVKNGLSHMWRFTDDLCSRNATDNALGELFAIDFDEMTKNWKDEVVAYLASIELLIPEHSVQITGGIDGQHTEKLGHLLCEMQYLQRAYPDAKW